MPDETASLIVIIQQHNDGSNGVGDGILTH